MGLCPQRRGAPRGSGPQGQGWEVLKPSALPLPWPGGYIACPLPAQDLTSGWLLGPLLQLSGRQGTVSALRHQRVLVCSTALLGKAGFKRGGHRSACCEKGRQVGVVNNSPLSQGSFTLEMDTASLCDCRERPQVFIKAGGRRQCCHAVMSCRLHL